MSVEAGRRIRDALLLLASWVLSASSSLQPGAHRHASADRSGAARRHPSRSRRAASRPSRASATSAWSRTWPRTTWTGCVGGRCPLRESIYPHLARSGTHEDMMVASGVLADGLLVNHLVNWLTPYRTVRPSRDGERGALVADTAMGDLTFYGAATRPCSGTIAFRGSARPDCALCALRQTSSLEHASARDSSRRGQRARHHGRALDNLRVVGHRLGRHRSTKSTCEGAFGRSSSTARPCSIRKPLSRATQTLYSARGRPRPCSDERVHVRKRKDPRSS